MHRPSFSLVFVADDLSPVLSGAAQMFWLHPPRHLMPLSFIHGLAIPYSFAEILAVHSRLAVLRR